MMFRPLLSLCCFFVPLICAVSSETFPDLNVTLKLAGSEYAQPLLTQWIQTYTNSIAFTEEYRGPMTFNTSMNASHFINTQSSASSPPYAFLQSDRPLTDIERAALSQAMNGPVLHLPAAITAMAIVYNLNGVSGLNGTTRLQLSADVVAKIFTGKITKWNDSALSVDNAALKDHDVPIQVFVRGETHCSATYDLANDYLSAFNATEWNKAGQQDGPAQFVSSAIPVYSGADMIAFMKNTTNAIGYVKVAEAQGDFLNTNSAALRNRAGEFVKYDPAAVLKAAENTIYPKNATHSSWQNFSISVALDPLVYPGATLSYFIVGSSLTYMKDPVSSDAVNDFLEWYNTHPDARTVPEGFQAIPLPLRTQNLAALSFVKWAPYAIGPAAEKFSLTGVGSSFPSELIKVWISKLSARKSWRDKHDGVVTFDSPNGDDSSSFLTQQATSPKYPFLQVDNHLNESAYQQLRSGVGEVLTLPFVISAVSVIYNLQDAEARGIKVRPLNLTADLTCMIFTGNITMWNDSRLVSLNPGLKNHTAPIKVIVRNETVGSTTYDLVHDYFGAFNATGYDPNGDQLGPGQFTKSAFGLRGGSSMTTKVANTANSIGYSKKKTAEQGKLGDWSAALENVAGKFVTPTSAAVMAAAEASVYPASNASWADFYVGRSPSPSAYPASAMAYFLVSRNLGYLPPGDRSALRDFLIWVVSDHQAKAELPLGFVPVVPSVREKNLAAISTLCLDCTQPSMKDMSSSEARGWVAAVIVIIIIAVVASGTFMCWRHDACAACRHRMEASHKSRLPMEDTEEIGTGMLAPVGYDQHRGSLPTGPSLTLDEHDIDLEENGNSSYHKKRKNVNDTASPVEVEMDKQ